MIASKPTLYLLKKDWHKNFDVPIPMSIDPTAAMLCGGGETPMKNNIVPIVRQDGLTIFEDENDPTLNAIRRRGTRQQVILAVAFRRFQQIALGYSAKWAPDLYDQLRRAVDHKALPVTDEVVSMLPIHQQEKSVELGEAVVVS